MYKKSVGILMIMILVLGGLGIQVKGTSNKLDIHYFYNNPCGSCDIETPFYEMFNEEVGDLKGEVNYQITLHNTFQLESKSYFEKVCEALGIVPEEMSQPFMVVGEAYLSGEEQIASGLRGVFEEQMQFMPEIILGNQEETEQGPQYTLQESKEEDTGNYLVYFYTMACDDCNKTRELLGEIDPTYDVKVQDYNIGEAEGTELINAYFNSYKVSEKDQQVPIIFYDGGYLSGYNAIEQSLAEVIESGQTLGALPSIQMQEIEEISLGDMPKLFVTGLINGFNPCSISMLLLLLSLVSVGTPILKLGMAYIVGKAITYVSLGTILYSVMTMLSSKWFESIQGLINLFIIGVLLILVMMNLLDFVAAREEKYNRIKLQLPTRLRQFNHKLIKSFVDKSHSKYALLGIFILGVVVSAGEFLCTGQIYLATLIYLLQKTGGYTLMTFVALLVYVGAMIIPLIVIIWVVYKGQKVLVVSEFIRQHMGSIKLINAIVLLVIAAVLMFF